LPGVSGWRSLAQEQWEANGVPKKGDRAKKEFAYRVETGSREVINKNASQEGCMGGGCFVG